MAKYWCVAFHELEPAERATATDRGASGTMYSWPVRHDRTRSTAGLKQVGAVHVATNDCMEAAMSETNEHATLDFSKGVDASGLTDGGMILGRVGDEEVVLAQSGSELSPSGALFALPRAARRGAHRRRDRPLSVASRVLQPPHRRGASGAGAGSDRLLARGAGRRPVFVREKLPTARPVPASISCPPAAVIDRDRRWRRGRCRRRRDAAARGLRRRAHS